MSAESGGPAQEPLTAEHFTHHGTSFQVKRMDPLLAHQVTEYLRPYIFETEMSGTGRGLSSILSLPGIKEAADKNMGIPGDMVPMLGGLLDVILRLPPPIMERLRIDLFAHIVYRSADMSDYDNLSKTTSAALAGLPRGVIYVLIVRAFVVNFSDFLPEILSLIPGFNWQEIKATMQSEQ